MGRKTVSQKALTALNYDLFQGESLTQPETVAPYIKIQEEAAIVPNVEIHVSNIKKELPSLVELSQMFDRFNWIQCRIPCSI